jgi:hypothetical protein
MKNLSNLVKDQVRNKNGELALESFYYVILK